jgi:hypothetical protein
MTVWVVPPTIRKAFAHVLFTTLGTVGFPTKVYINNHFLPKLIEALQNVIDRGLTKELKRWDGCYIIRKKRFKGSWSMHAWGLAIDVNANENPQGQVPKLSPEFVRCFTDAGMKWGGEFEGKDVDGMHFEDIL